MRGGTIRAFGAACLAVAMSTTAVTTARADVGDADRQKARALMAEGRVHRDRDDLQGALDAFRAADAIMHVPTTTFEVGRTQVSLGLLLEARATLEKVVQYPVQPGEPTPFVRARRGAATLLAELDARTPSLRVVVKAPHGVRPAVTIDGVAVLDVGGSRKVNPGPHVVIARAGGLEAREEVRLIEAEAREVSLTIAPPTPRVALAVPPPERARASGGGGFGRTLTFVGIAVAATGVVAGSVSGIASLSYTSSARTGCNGGQCPPDTHGDLQRASDLATVANISFIAAGGGLLLAGVGLILPSPQAPVQTGKPTVEPYVSLGGGGVRGAF